MGDDTQVFYPPATRIKNVFDLNPWYFSKAYKEYMDFLRDLNKSVTGVKTTDDIKCSECIMNFVEMFDEIEKIIDETQLEAVEEQRFGNKAYRKFYDSMKNSAETLLLSVLPISTQLPELLPYFTESFGNATRIDYGSGHEANFLVFLFCLRKLEIFKSEDNPALVLRVFNKYLRVCRHLQIKFKMEPAGSRGVHALDDFQFAPFMFGSAQLIGQRNIIPDSYLKKTVVDTNAHLSLFLEAVQFINENKTGPFHEHSNQLWNISAVPNWKKVNEGMFKMYEGEVLKKFPVVQHFMFGSIFSYDRRDDIEESELANAPPSYDPNVAPPATHLPGRMPRPAQHGMFAFKIPSVAQVTGVKEANVAESGSLKRLHDNKHPDEKCPPPMTEP